MLLKVEQNQSTFTYPLYHLNREDYVFVTADSTLYISQFTFLEVYLSFDKCIMSPILIEDDSYK